MSYEVMVGNKAAAIAVKLARVQVASAYPITTPDNYHTVPQ